MATDPKNEPFWQGTVRDVVFPPVIGDLKVDVAVVGGGIAGVTAALLLKRAGKKVALVERFDVGGGETGHTTAHITQLLDEPYGSLIEILGVKKARTVLESVRASMEQIARWAMADAKGCDFDRVPAYLYTEKAEDEGYIKREVEAAKALGLPASFSREVPLPFPVKAALVLEDQAQFHPLKYLYPLAKLVDGDGSHVFERTPVLTVDEREACAVKTERGTIFAEAVIVTANVPVSNKLLLIPKIAAYRTYAIAARVERPPSRGLFYDTADPYHYTRLHPHEGGALLVVGGCDHKVAEGNEQQAFSDLIEYATDRYQVKEVVYRWSGQIAEPYDGLPFIGRNALSRKVFVATGFSGTGMTFGTLSGMILSELAVGNAHPYESLYRATRKRASGLKDFVKENLDFPKHLVKDRVAPPEARSLDEVPVGEGRIVAVGKKRVAVFKDEEGKCHGLSPVCTHLYCHVAWNGAEKSWDCACHGSRFDAKGAVMNGPATKPLKKLELPAESDAALDHEKENEMNALSYLRTQHEEVEAQFARYMDFSVSDPPVKRAAFLRIADSLTAHAQIEEELFYPAVRARSTEALVERSFAEHGDVKALIAELIDLDASLPAFDVKVRQLMGMVREHVNEEQGSLFPMAEKLLSAAELTELGKKLDARFMELHREIPPMDENDIESQSTP